MTAKELAEDYAEHNQGKYTSEFGNLYHAYLTGYKAGRAAQWHKFADGDLPSLRKEVLWRVDNQLWLGELLESRIDFGEWELDSVLFDDHEIVWKEV